mgnify:CR=1 FL=1
MAREKKHRSRGRRSPLAAAALIGAGLLITGAVYAGASAAFAASDTQSASTQLTVEDGEKLFQANCATCHGPNAEGTTEAPSLVGVGAAAVVLRDLAGIFGIQFAETGELLDADVENLIEERIAARKAKNFARSDEIRDQLAQEGIILEDTPQGTRWHRK